jgi:hypothetical protein
MTRKNNKRQRDVKPESDAETDSLPELDPETDIIVWPTDEEVYDDVEDELEPEECICIDDEITEIKASLDQIRKDIYNLIESVLEIKRIVSFTPKKSSFVG